MSADNMIYIQRRKKLWWVWMGFASDDGKPKPNKKRDVFFDTEREALIYAHGWVRGETIVEYGVVLLNPE